MKIIYLNDAMRATEALLTEFGREHKYERPSSSTVSCRYWHPSAVDMNDATFEEVEAGSPGCIVGWVLFKEGVPATAVAALDGRGSISTCHGQTVEHGIRLTPAAVQFLQQAQFRQDSGWTWGEAVSYAKGYMAVLQDGDTLQEDE